MLTRACFCVILTSTRIVLERKVNAMTYETFDAVKIGNTLKDLRKRSKETAEAVARAIDISQSALGMYENGKRIPRDEIKIRIAEHYCVPVESIFFPKQ